MIFCKDSDSQKQLLTTIPAIKPLNHPSLATETRSPVRWTSKLSHEEDYNDQVSVGITRGITSVTSFKNADP